MKLKFIISSVLIIALILEGFIMFIFFPNNRKHYKIYEENGKYYYINYYDNLTRTINEKVWIKFEDDLALINEYKVSWGMTYNINVWKYIDKKGKVVLQPDVYIADAFSEGLAAVMPDEGSYWGYINKNGEMVINPQYRRTSMFKDGFASVYIGNDGGKWILINNKGEFIRDLNEPLNWNSYTQVDPKHDTKERSIT